MPAIPIIKFINELKSNQIRTQNMFEMEVESDIPDVQKVLDGITMYGSGFTLPTRTQEFAEVGFKGFTLPIPTVMKMEQDHTMTVNADVDGNYRRAFLAWAGAVANPDIEGGSLFNGDRRFGNSKIRIKLLGYSMDTPVEKIVLTGVRIASVGGLQVSNTDSGVSTFEVQFKSLYWYIEKVESDSYPSKFTSAEQHNSTPKLTDQK